MNLLEVTLDKLFEVLGTDPELGLTGEQVSRNRREFGENILFEKKNTIFDLFKKIFSDVMMALFLLVSFFDYLETSSTSSLAALIFVVVLYSTFVLFAHFYVEKTKKIVEKYSRSKYHVRRSGKICTVAKSEIVPGDLLLLEKGDVMPCDGIILRQSALKILEASVTGRRVPVFKRTHEEVQDKESGFPYFECILFAGSVVLHGSCKVFVCNTGKNIFDNQNFTVSRQNTTVPRIYNTAMELKKQISLIWVIASLFLLAWGVFFGLGVFDVFYYVCAMIIAAFPDAIEHLCDLAISYMTRKLFLEGAVLRNPGAIDRLCDVNSVFVNSSEYLFYSHPIASAFYLGQDWYDFKEKPQKAIPLLENLLLAQSRKEYFSGKKDEWKSERAILSAAASVGLQRPKLLKDYLLISQYDFDPRYGYSCSLVMQNGSYRLIIRGNPNSVLTACSEIYKKGESVSMNESLRSSLRSEARHLAGMCERVFAVATLNLSSPSTGDQRALCRGMTYLGLFGLSTPISAAAANAVSVCQNSGISTYLLTEDYPETVASLAKSVSIIGQDDYQRALSFEKYERMDRGVFVADIEKYKAYCGFPVEEKQSIVKYHKDNGNITLSLTSGVLDTLPQMESDISVVGSEEKLNSVRLNADLLVKEKRYEIIPLCINWARVFYRNVVHIMQFIVLQQVAFALLLFINVCANSSLPFSPLPMLLIGIGACIPSALNIYHRRPGPYLENNEGVLKDDRIASLRALLLIPFVIGTTQALCVMLARQIAFYATQNALAASGIALITFAFSAYFSSISIKFDTPLLENLKEIGRCGIITFCTCAVLSYLVSFSPMIRLWIDAAKLPKIGFFPLLFAILFSLVPMLMMEGIKMIKIKDDSANSEIHKNQKGE